jgi:hypothetical protein
MWKAVIAAVVVVATFVSLTVNVGATLFLLW